MIFLTVGHQMPFDRLVRLVDGWAGQSARHDIFAQIGRAAYQPTNFPYTDFLEPAAFGYHVRACTAMVAHAGTGSIISALHAGKPILVLPRLSRLEETRSDHQFATALRFAEAGQLRMARNDEDFVRQLGEIERFRPRLLLGSSASRRLLTAIERFISIEAR